MVCRIKCSINVESKLNYIWICKLFVTLVILFLFQSSAWMCRKVRTILKIIWKMWNCWTESDSLLVGSTFLLFNCWSKNIITVTTMDITWTVWLLHNANFLCLPKTETFSLFASVKNKINRKRESGCDVHF